MENKNNSKNISIVLGMVFISSLFIFATIPETKKTDSKVAVVNYFPDKVDFAGEEAPLKISDVRERLDRELLVNENLHASTILILKRANRAFSVIEPILKKNGVPDDFKYLAVIESGLVNVVSPAGAKGIWQFMPETAKERSMNVII